MPSPIPIPGEPAIRAKTQRIAIEFHQIDDRLREKVSEMAFYANGVLSVPFFVVTCIYRTTDENRRAGGRAESLHILGPPFRALDLRTRGLLQTNHVTDLKQWWYGQGFPVGFDFVDETAKKAGPHIHVEMDRRVA